MIPSKPYLIRAIYEWIVDNNLTPQITVDAAVPGTTVPKKYIHEGYIVLDISPTAINNLVINNHALECKARFAGASHKLHVPIEAIMMIYAAENNRGLMFATDDDELLIDEFIEDDDPIPPATKDKTQLKLVSDDDC